MFLKCSKPSLFLKTAGILPAAANQPKALEVRANRACDDGVGSSARLEQELSTMKIGRSAKTGQFVPVREAQRKSSTHVVETIKPSPKPKK